MARIGLEPMLQMDTADPIYKAGHPIHAPAIVETNNVENESSWWDKFWQNFTHSGENVPYIDTHNLDPIGDATTNYPTPSMSDFLGEDVNTIIDGGSTNDTGSDNDVNSALENITSSMTGPSISDYLKNNPNASPEDALKYMSQYSDEFAEKYIDYLLEKQSINEQNEYSANREDTAYQRLVKDLKAAGLNPALMYGSSASISSGGSVGTISSRSGANSRSISNYSKFKSLVLNYLIYAYTKDMKETTAVLNNMHTVSSLLIPFLAMLA